jgi:arylsulfatase A-like enzyme
VRARLNAGWGLGAGVVSGLLIGIVEAYVIAQGGFGEEAQVLWFGPLAYAVVLGGLGLLGGLALAVLPMQRDEGRGWTPSLAVVGLLVPFALAITLFRLRRDVYLEQMPPLPVLAAVLGAAGVFALLVLVFGRRFFGSRAGAFVHPLPALALLAGVTVVGAVAARVAVPAAPEPPAPPPASAELAERPNLILIMVDTLRADHLSCYGSERVQTPAICSLAEDGGTRYDGFSHASWTKPATASLLASLLPSSHMAMSKTAVLAEDVTLISEAVQRAGYVTGGIVTNINLAPSFGFQQGYDEYYYLAPDYLAGAGESSSKLILYQIARSVWFKLKRGHRVGDFYQDSATVNEVAFDWLTRHKDARFFLFLHYMDPHDPYFEHDDDGGYSGTAVARVSNQHPDPGLAPEMNRLYDGEIRYLDAQIARLLDQLRALGVYDDTLIVLTADHGEEFHEHGGFWHGLTLYDEQIRVPLIVKWPREVASDGQPSDGGFARLIDVAPTLIARSGGEIPEAMRGVDLAVAGSERSETERMAFAEEDHEGNVIRALRTQNWKLIETNEGNPRGLPARELFDMERDPGETRDLHDTYGDVAASLRQHSDAHEQLARSGAVEGGEAVELSDEQRAALQALGYVE